jgi:hypothetical protein
MNNQVKLINNQAIKDLISEKMNGWNGETPRQIPPPKKTLKVWTEEMYQWASEVRRDILVLEYHLKLKDPTAPLYGDPGDPPPPPE